MNATTDILPHTQSDFEELMLAALELAAWKGDVVFDEATANKIVRGTTQMMLKTLSLMEPDDLVETVKRLGGEI